MLCAAWCDTLYVVCGIANARYGLENTHKGPCKVRRWWYHAVARSVLVDPRARVFVRRLPKARTRSNSDNDGIELHRQGVLVYAAANP